MTGKQQPESEFPPAPLPGGPAHYYVITFPAPGAPVSMNATNKHWAQLHAARKVWKNAAHRAFLEHEKELTPWRGYRVEVTIALPVPDARRRDPHNYTETVKRVIDGVVNSGTLIPDDNSVWVTVPEPVLWRGDCVKIRVRTAGTPEQPAHW